MLYVGFTFISLALGLFVYDKCALIRQAAVEYSQTFALLVYMRGAVVSERRTPAEAIIAFSKTKDGMALPWLKELSTADRVNSFLREKRLLSSSTALQRDDAVVLADFFADFGMHTAEDEILRLDSVIKPFERKSQEKSASAEKEIKAVRILFVTVVLGLFILMI